MLLFVVVLLKRTIYNKETKREAENERRKNERSQNGHKKELMADSAPDPKKVLKMKVMADSKKDPNCFYFKISAITAMKISHC